MKTPVVVPVEPFHDCEFQLVACSPSSMNSDEFGFERAVDLSDIAKSYESPMVPIDVYYPGSRRSRLVQQDGFGPLDGCYRSVLYQFHRRMNLINFQRRVLLPAHLHHRRRTHRRSRGIHAPFKTRHLGTLKSTQPTNQPTQYEIALAAANQAA